MWGSTDIVSLAKTFVKLSDKLAEKKEASLFQARGGVMDGSRLTADQVKDVSKWPSREEQLSILLGQILSPGAKLASQLTSVGGALASQIKQKGEGEDGAPAEGAAPEPATA
jgi:ribosomal protein L10